MLEVASVPEIPDDPPDEDQEPPEVPPDEPQEAAVLIPDEVLDPEALVPVDNILARVQGITAQDVATSIALSTRALQIRVIQNDTEQAAVDALRDGLKAHEDHVKGVIDPYRDLANRLHKGMTGLQAVALDRVPDAIKHAGAILGTWIRAKQEAEAERQRLAREQAVAAERTRLIREGMERALEQARLEKQALAATSREEAAALEQQAAEVTREVEQIRVEAATVTAPPVAAQDIGKPEGGSIAPKWKALPVHAEDQAEMPLNDLRALVIDVGQRAKDGDDSLLCLLKPDWPACNSLAKSQKTTMKVAGIRAVNAAVYSKRRG